MPNATKLKALKALVSQPHLEILDAIVNPNGLSNISVACSQHPEIEAGLTHTQAHWDIWAFVITRDSSPTVSDSISFPALSMQHASVRFALRRRLYIFYSLH